MDLLSVHDRLSRPITQIEALETGRPERAARPGGRRLHPPSLRHLAGPRRRRPGPPVHRRVATRPGRPPPVDRTRVNPAVTGRGGRGDLRPRPPAGLHPDRPGAQGRRPVDLGGRARVVRVRGVHRASDRHLPGGAPQGAPPEPPGGGRERRRMRRPILAQAGSPGSPASWWPSCSPDSSCWPPDPRAGQRPHPARRTAGAACRRRPAGSRTPPPPASNSSAPSATAPPSDPAGYGRASPDADRAARRVRSLQRDLHGRRRPVHRRRGHLGQLLGADHQLDLPGAPGQRGRAAGQASSPSPPRAR